MYHLYTDPYLYANYAISAVACFALWKFGKNPERHLENHYTFMAKFLALAALVVFALYATDKLGDISMQRYADSTRESK